MEMIIIKDLTIITTGTTTITIIMVQKELASTITLVIQVTILGLAQIMLMMPVDEVDQLVLQVITFMLTKDIMALITMVLTRAPKMGIDVDSKKSRF